MFEVTARCDLCVPTGVTGHENKDIAASTARRAPGYFGGRDQHVRETTFCLGTRSSRVEGVNSHHTDERDSHQGNEGDELLGTRRWRSKRAGLP